MVCTMAMCMMPWHAYAEVTVTVEGNRVTVNATPAGSLATYVNGLTDAQKNELRVDEIAFVGDFSQDDLEVLRGFGYKTVDMSEAKFPQSYSQMKFNYWSSSIEKAVTSKYADNNISSEIFNNCKNLTEVDYKGGNVTGFLNHKTSEGYASGLKVTIGKNVTSIDNYSFQNCTALSTLEFDKDYADGNADKLDGVTYPRELTIGQSAFQDCANLTGVEFPNRVVSIGNDAFKQAGTNVDEMTVTFERRFKANGASIDFDHDLTIGNSAFFGCTTIKEVELPIRLTTLGNDAFKQTSNMTSVSIREDIEDARLRTIPSGAFQESGVKNLVVPRSVTLIESNAFGSCYDLESVTFQEQLETPQLPLVIKKMAFAGGNEYAYKLKDVYVDINPDNRLMVCEKDAFSFISLVGQTQVDSKQAATLHFSKDYWDFYAGDWKLGLSFSQNELNSMKDGYRSDDGKYIGGVNDQNHIDIDQTTGKYETGDSNTEYAPANGWQQFAHTTTGIDIIIPEGEFLRTYSTTTAYDFPMTTGSNPKQAVRMFRIIRFDDGYQPGDDVSSRDVANSRPRFAYSKEITDNIPENTGMIMVGQADAAVLSYFKPTTKTGYPTFPYTETQQDASQDDSDTNPTNLLVGTLDQDVTLNPTEPYHAGAIQYRIFTFRAADKRFLRVKPGTVASKQKAYLKLSKSLFHWQDESGGTGQDATQENTGANSAHIAFVFDMEEVSGLQTIAIDADGQMHMVDDDAYYTLQGVRVERPTSKGIYIHHGRKIIVK